MSTRQTLRDFLTSIGSAASSISLPVDPGPNEKVDEGDDLGIEPTTGKPLMDIYDGGDGESLTGDYVSFITARNEYQIAPGGRAAVSPIRGSIQSTAENTGAVEVFADSSVGDNAQSLNRSNSEIFDESGYPLETSIINKTGNSTIEAPNGNTLLSDVVAASANSDTSLDQSTAVVASFAALKKYNRYSPTSSPSQFSNNDSGFPITPDEYSDSRPMRVQIGEGEYENEVFEISAEISQDTLVSVAKSMMLRAAGWDPATTPNLSVDPNKFFDEDVVLGKYPSILSRDQASPDAFRAQDSFGVPLSDNGEDSFLAGRGDLIQKSVSESKYTQTRGSTHVPDQSFGDLDSDQATQAAIAMAALASLIDVKFTNLSEYFGSVSQKDDRVLRGPYYLGTSLKTNLPDDVNAQTRALVHSFLFQPGIFSYTACFKEGLYACFGFKAGQGPGLQSSSPINPAGTFDTGTIVSNYKEEIERIANNLTSLGYKEWNSPMKLSHGFWRSVAESALRSILNIKNSAQNFNGADYVSCLVSLQDSLAIKIINVFGTIGYQRLILQEGTSSESRDSGTSVQNPYDLDAYPQAPGTRQMKSRDGKLLGRSSLAWRNSSVPSMFILPVEAMAASLDMDYTFDPEKGSNPIKGMLGSTLYDKTYVKGFRNDNSIPSIVTKVFEDRLSAEYVPFYFRDLRTNEIVAFHAFLEQLSDSYSANYGETKGFGRADPVMNYANTARSLSLSFYIVSTSKADFDEMWYKINKLTTFVYPQYTRGRLVQQKENVFPVAGATFEQNITFEQPFSQLAGGTPVIRMRIGDLIKTNYSRFNLGRLFGIGNDTFNVVPTSDKASAGVLSGITGGKNSLKDLGVSGKNSFGTQAVDFANNIDLRLVPFLAYAGSPMELLTVANFAAGFIPSSSPGFQSLTQAALDVSAEFFSRFLKNGFVNPLLDKDRSAFLGTGTTGLSGDSFTDDSDAELFLGIKSRVILKANPTPYIATITNSSGTTYKKVRLRRPVFVRFKSKASSDAGATFSVTIDDPTVGEEYNGLELKISQSDLYIDAGQIVSLSSFPGALLSIGAIGGITGVAASALSNLTSNAITAGDSAPLDVPLADFFGSIGRTFTSPYSNPITKAFEDRMGEGLAGVVRQMSFTWMDLGAWEVDWNSRAPTACKVNITFAPIHDISPGLDSNGYNRAPIYNVGQVMNDAFGQPRSDGGNSSRYFYKKGGAIAETSRNSEE